jgi:DNA-binding protein H-NS
MDLSHFSLVQLRSLQDDIGKQMKKREQDELAKAREEIMSIAQGLGLSVKELLGNVARAKTRSVAAQFANPANPAQQWSGRGRQPVWVKEWIAQGKDKDLLKL